jgi:hypothetical protein
LPELRIIYGVRWCRTKFGVWFVWYNEFVYDTLR